MGEIKAICLSDRKGIQKTCQDEAELIAEHGVGGDAHAGAWHRQVSLLPLEHIQAFREKGAKVNFGDFGENIVVSGLDLDSMKMGDRLVCGEALLELTQFGKECHTRCNIFHTMGDCIMPRHGVFARVLKGGMIHIGDDISPVVAPEGGE